ncbi:hypothetical protein ANCCAN_01550 [Ancylostoma caninum]|uniref:Uncharacterized protein n=1 Tax=Ancylostoma caninum TaxID=29170 RepID=A0A368H9T9_ANCCA|nr:hypothetical protein ANCCAN_01550 [Ancylostoma caninum]
MFDNLAYRSNLMDVLSPSPVMKWYRIISFLSVPFIQQLVQVRTLAGEARGYL